MPHKHSLSESGRVSSVPMWDSADPTRSPLPLPLNPGMITRANTSENIQAAANRLLDSPTRLDSPKSIVTRMESPTRLNRADSPFRLPRSDSRSDLMPILQENTPPSATVRAMRAMSSTPATSTLPDDVSAQLTKLTNIASSLQHEMSQLSRRSKDNAADLSTLKEATNRRDDEIKRALNNPIEGPFSLEGTATMAMLEKIIRDMATLSALKDVMKPKIEIQQFGLEKQEVMDVIRSVLGEHKTTRVEVDEVSDSGPLQITDVGQREVLDGLRDLSKTIDTRTTELSSSLRADIQGLQGSTALVRLGEFEDDEKISDLKTALLTRLDAMDVTTAVTRQDGKLDAIAASIGLDLIGMLTVLLKGLDVKDVLGEHGDKLDDVLRRLGSKGEEVSRSMTLVDGKRDNGHLDATLQDHREHNETVLAALADHGLAIQKIIDGEGNQKMVTLLQEKTTALDDTLDTRLAALEATIASSRHDSVIALAEDKPAVNTEGLQTQFASLREVIGESGHDKVVALLKDKTAVDTETLREQIASLQQSIDTGGHDTIVALLEDNKTELLSALRALSDQDRFRAMLEQKIDAIEATLQSRLDEIHTSATSTDHAHLTAVLTDHKAELLAALHASSTQNELRALLEDRAATDGDVASRLSDIQAAIVSTDLATVLENKTTVDTATLQARIDEIQATIAESGHDQIASILENKTALDTTAMQNQLTSVIATLQDKTITDTVALQAQLSALSPASSDLGLAALQTTAASNHETLMTLLHDHKTAIDAVGVQVTSPRVLEAISASHAKLDEHKTAMCDLHARTFDSLEDHKTDMNTALGEIASAVRYEELAARLETAGERHTADMKSDATESKTEVLGALSSSSQEILEVMAGLATGSGIDALGVLVTQIKDELQDMRAGHDDLARANQDLRVERDALRAEVEMLRGSDTASLASALSDRRRELQEIQERAEKLTAKVKGMKKKPGRVMSLNLAGNGVKRQGMRVLSLKDSLVEE